MSTTTTSDAALAATLQEHVAEVKALAESGGTIRTCDPLFAEMFKHVDNVSLNITNVDGGVYVRSTAIDGDACVAQMIKAHAAVVSLFVENGMSETRMCKAHSVPSCAAGSSSASTTLSTTATSTDSPTTTTTIGTSTDVVDTASSTAATTITNRTKKTTGNSITYFGNSTLSMSTNKTLLSSTEMTMSLSATDSATMATPGEEAIVPANSGDRVVVGFIVAALFVLSLIVF